MRIEILYLAVQWTEFTQVRMVYANIYTGSKTGQVHKTKLAVEEWNPSNNERCTLNNLAPPNISEMPSQYS
jgi:hypothetical protein